MSVTSGFFNSLNHDRRYSAQQMSAIFDGIINDGVFANIGVAFKVSAADGVTVNIGEGKCWFNSAWVYNDAILPLTLEASEVVLDRIDAIVIDIDHTEPVRSGTIKIVKGTPSSSPKRPAMVTNAKHKQAPLAYIYRKAGSTEITQANITSMIGTSECPYITGILQVQNIDSIVAQWGAQWNEWYAAKVAESNSDVSELNAQWNEWYAAKVAETNSATSEIQAEMQAEFDTWFDDFKSVLDDDVATSLAAKVADLIAKFDTLAKEAAVYDEIEDSDLDEILGSDGTPIQGKTIIGSGTGGSVDLSEPMSGNLDMNGYRVMNVSDPEQDDDAANAGYVKMVAAEVAYKTAAKASFPRNLLDNSDFSRPVAQAGFNSVHGNAHHVIDRWIGSADGTVGGYWVDGNDNLYVVVPTNAHGISQKVKVLPGKTYTFAAKINAPSGGFKLIISDTIYANIGEKSTYSGTSVGHVTVTIPHNVTEIYASICPANNPDGGAANLYWAALYEGEYTAETLPEYQPKGYENELLVCRQYDLSTGEYIGLRKFGYAHNLLDNSDFRNPVNQRGVDYYSGSVLTVDRWNMWCLNGEMYAIVENDCVRFWNGGKSPGSFGQKFPLGTFGAGKKYTFAYMTADGNITVVHNPIERYDWGEAVNISLAPNETKLMVWAAIYEGEYTIDTLPEYQPKGYGAELAECQRYYFESDFNTQAIAFDAYSFYAPYMYLPVQMRENCNISVTPVSKNGTQNALSRWTGSEYVDVTDYIPVTSKTAISFRSNGGFVTGSIYATSKVIVSADL